MHFLCRVTMSESGIWRILKKQRMHGMRMVSVALIGQIRKNELTAAILLIARSRAIALDLG